MKKGILLLLIGWMALFQASAQNWDINTVKKINSWDMHGLSKAFSQSGPI